MNKLFELRNKKNMTRQQLSIKVRLSERTIEEIENNTKKVPLRNAMKLAKYFEVPMLTVFSISHLDCSDSFKRIMEETL